MDKLGRISGLGPAGGNADEGPTPSADSGGYQAPASVVARYVYGAIVAAIVIRGLSWLFSLFLVGPVLGTASFALSGTDLGNSSPVVLEAILALLVLAMAAGIVIGMRRNTPRWRKRVQHLGLALALNAVWYVGSVMVALVVWGGWSNLVENWWLILTVLISNSILLWLGVMIVRRTRRRLR